jgi:2-polyprenyl-3-methyl-5-hydroxy-6-metoxy-1,4-benzoquinol methylase
MISACMIVQDEEECIARCLDSIQDYVDEIVVIDGGSIDRTKEIVLQYSKVNLYEIPFEKDFGKQRNNAIERAQGDWIFIIDADEYCYPYILDQLEYLTTLDNDSYTFTRKTLINGKLVNPLNLDYTFRFFQSHCRYAGNIHEPLTGFNKRCDTNMEIIHDKKGEWQQKDNELYWDMGQVPPEGWQKIGDKWVWVGDSLSNKVIKRTDNSLSALLCIYNEKLMLRQCLTNLVKFVDEIVIVDGGYVGPSNDGSKAIIDEFMQNHLMIKYYSGIFAYPDGAWDEPSQVNFGLSQVTKGYVMRTQPDLIYDVADMDFLRTAINDGKKYIYCPQVDFWGDTGHILLYRNSTMEGALLHQAVVDPLAVSMNCNYRAVSQGELRQFGMVADIDYANDIQYLPHVKKYHFGFVKPFADQVEKYAAYAKRGDMGLEQQGNGLRARYEFAINHVLDGYANQGMKYYGHFPDDALTFRNMNYKDGYDEFMEWFDNESNQVDFSKPTKEGFEDTTLEQAKVMSENTSWQWGAHEAIPENPSFHFSEMKILEIIKSLGKKVSILDIGCANALFITYYKKYGISDRTVGIDISEKGIEFAIGTCRNNDVELELYVSAIEQFNYPEKFDVIRMTETLEHIIDIPKVLEKINSLLNAGGHFIGTTPYGNTCDGEGHLHYFVDDDLKNLLAEYFDIIEFDILDYTGEGENHFFFHCRRKA